MPSQGLINNPGAAYGGSAISGLQERQVFRNTSATAVVAGDLCILDSSVPSTATYPGNLPGANAIKSAAAADSPLVIGFAAEAAAAGAVFEVITGGLAPQVNVATGTAAGAGIGSSATAGRAAVPGTAVPGSVIGFVVGAAAASNLADVWVAKC